MQIIVLTVVVVVDKHHKQKNKKTIESETQASFFRHLIFVTRTHVLRSFIAPVYRTNRVNRYINTAFTRFYSNPALIFCSLHENRNTSIFCRTSAAKKSPRKKTQGNYNRDEYYYLLRTEELELNSVID